MSVEASILTTEQWEQVSKLASTLDREQAIWVTGYLAGRNSLVPPTLPGATNGNGNGNGNGAAALAAAPAAVASRTATILYATDTGNSKELAGMLAAAVGAKGVETKVADLSDYKTRGLKDEQDVLLIAATHGEGEPPPAALDFFEFIEGKRAPKLEGVRFAVLALGDSTYEHYCQAGKILDARFEALGAERIADRVDCDVDYEDDADAWIATVADKLTPEAAPTAVAPTAVNGAAPAAPGAPSAYSKRNPFPAAILENVILTGRGSTKETRHLELSLEGSGLTYEPGDALGIVAENDPVVVESLLGTLGLSGDETVSLKAGDVSLREALTHTYEITASTPRFLTQWAELSGSKNLLALSEGSAKARTDFLELHHPIDFARKFPVRGVTAEQLLAGLRPLQPRLYSIASSLAAAPDEAHLTVSTVQYRLYLRERIGVASGYLGKRTDEDTVPVYISENDHFRLPADDQKIIMVGAGTGVAPYRAFLQEREARDASGESWLFFGERHFRSDFLYQVEWQDWLKNGTLNRFDVAFSRDRTPRTYVQDKIRKQGADVYGWLEEGAVFYVCGDANAMAPDVHATLRDIVSEQRGVDAEAAEEYLAELKREHRYKLDVY
ncbi:MAG: assimilatory sulfite reductase (NADPH) flavoprotein subunit [Solirubrobacteraceae bacterium]|nr:assimilatory sulfite reductase (NADPH) flavoprotein subunit [Solirubrobacteraceae bacterium]